MKKLLVSLLLVMAGISNAGAHGYHGFWGPAIVGGVIGYSLYRPYYPPVYYQPPPVYYQPPPVYYYQQQPSTQYNAPAPAGVCSYWVETQHPDGTVTKTRNCN